MSGGSATVNSGRNNGPATTTDDYSAEQSSFCVSRLTSLSLKEDVRTMRGAQKDASKQNELHEHIPALLKQSSAACENMRAKDESLPSQAVEQGRRACLQLCDDIFTTLPPELREMIYEEILGINIYERVRKHGDANKPGVLGYSGLAFINARPRNSSKPGSQPLCWWLEE